MASAAVVLGHCSRPASGWALRQQRDGFTVCPLTPMHFRWEVGGGNVEHVLLRSEAAVAGWVLRDPGSLTKDAERVASDHASISQPCAAAFISPLTPMTFAHAINKNGIALRSRGDS